MLHLVKGAIPIFAILTVSFFSLIFLLRLVIQDHMQDQVNQLVVIRDYQESRWGQLPGALNYKYTKEVTFYGLDQDQKEKVGSEDLE